MAVALALVLAAAWLGFRHHAREDLSLQSREARDRVARLLDAETKRDARAMAALLEILAEDPCLRQSFESGDRARFLSCAGPRLARLEASCGIDRFSVHGPDGVNWLRVHSPASHGDRIDRASLRLAMETGAPAQGIELGPFGALSLRVVSPWHIGGPVGGYLELGKGLDRLAASIRDQLGADLAVLLDKPVLDRTRWTEERTARGLDADWDRLPSQVVAGATLALPDSALREATRKLGSGHEDLSEIAAGGRRFYIQSLPLNDAAGRSVGQVLVLSDVTDALARISTTLGWLALLAIGLGLGLAAGFWAYLGRVQESLAGAYDRLNASLALRQASEERLIAQEHTLAEEATRRERSIMEEQALGTLLRLALEASETLPYLQSSLDTLLEVVPWIRLQPRGGILLTEERDQGPVLRMAVARNLTPRRIDECSAVAFGSCLCGSAAETQTIVHTDGVSRGTRLCLSEVHDHGHYCVPIPSSGRIVGVLVLYLDLGHPSTEAELSFLRRAAEVLSIGISRRQAAEELRIARDEAQSASRAKSEFLASMSHEIRTPMNGVLGMAELLAEMPLGAEQRELVETIKGSGMALLTVINDILDFSKIEAGRLELEPIPFDLAAAAYEVTHLLSTRAEEKGLELILYYRPSCPRHFVGDPGRIRQILLNLAGNAVKFTEHGYVLIDVRQLAENDRSARIHIRIEDTGIGISQEVRGRLFESFVQADRSTTRRFGGTGLGLAISRQLVELMGGEIGVESELGVGSCFWFTLPLPLAEAPVEQAPPADLGGLRALVVDDHPVNQRVYQEQLKSFGIRTQVIGEPRLALDCLRAASAVQDPFHFALVDHAMPGMDGEQLAREIQADPGFARLPLVLLTSSGQRGDGDRFSSLGFSASLVKPVPIDTLRQCISRVMVRAGVSPARGDAPEPEGARIGEPRVEPAATPTPRFAGRVLLAEDNAVNRKVALGMLRRLGIEAEVAEDGEQALGLCRDNGYDLILMDCQMPVLDGFEATRAIRALAGGRRPVIVALTANAMESDRERCLAAGMDDYISKPFRQHDLIAAFERWLTKAE